jgi:predicted DNA-binding transcriptional regulator YafY
MNDHDKLATRLALILTKFNLGERLSVRELAEEFGVTQRSIQRDFKKLSYLPIEKQGGYYTLAPYCLGKLSYKDIQQFAAFSGIQELYPELNSNLIVDILNTRISKTMEIRGHRYEDLSQKVDLFNNLGAAILKQLQLHFTYKEKLRVVHPYRLVNTNGIWYLIATQEGKVKNFSLSKIEALSMSEEHFVPDEAVEELLCHNGGLWYTQDPIEVTLEVDASVAEYFLRRDLLPNQQVIENTEEKLILSAKVAYEEEILKTVRYWIPHLHITSPAYLQEKLEKSLQNYLHSS